MDYPMRRIGAAALLAAAIVAAAACSPPNSGNSDSGGEPEQQQTATAAEQQPAAQPEEAAAPAVRAAAEWNCGELKEQVFTVVDKLAGWGTALNPPDLSSIEPAVLVALLSAGDPFTPADQQALNDACELYGQHDAALELWADGNRGDACDVWTPAKAAADAKTSSTLISDLNPIVSQFWSAATGDVSEGHGRCIAYRAN